MLTQICHYKVSLGYNKLSTKDNKHQRPQVHCTMIVHSVPYFMEATYSPVFNVPQM